MYARLSFIAKVLIQESTFVDLKRRKRLFLAWRSSSVVYKWINFSSLQYPFSSRGKLLKHVKGLPSFLPETKPVLLKGCQSCLQVQWNWLSCWYFYLQVFQTSPLLVLIIVWWSWEDKSWFWMMSGGSWHCALGSAGSCVNDGKIWLLCLRLHLKIHVILRKFCVCCNNMCGVAFLSCVSVHRHVHADLSVNILITSTSWDCLSGPLVRVHEILVLERNDRNHCLLVIGNLGEKLAVGQDSFHVGYKSDS